MKVMKSLIVVLCIGLAIMGVYFLYSNMLGEKKYSPISLNILNDNLESNLGKSIRVTGTILPVLGVLEGEKTIYTIKNDGASMNFLAYEEQDWVVDTVYELNGTWSKGCATATKSKKNCKMLYYLAQEK